ncbi:MAG: hypothetical protein V3V53_02405 [Bacteroidales bacterium]
MKRRIIIIICLFLSLSSFAQDLSGLRSRYIQLPGDSVKLDSLMILPGSVFLFDRDNNRIPDSLYEVLPVDGTLVIHPSLLDARVMVKYRVLAPATFQPYYHKDPSNLQEKVQGRPADPFRITSEDLQQGGYYTYSELNKRGSLSRGITFGNNQDVVVNSNLNLQLTGKISNNLNILAAISDNNIPIQPEGYSQQISEFDRVYISVFNEQLGLVAGDFELTGSPGMFMNFYKRSKGAMFNGKFKLGNTDKDNFKTTVSGAISKGKFSKNSFMGIEGNQGPYKLRGSNHEQFITVLAGSERVYIDGRLLTRGINNDYTVDYNNAEITFTPMQTITKDRRIIVEFEYTERSYARFLLYTANEYQTENGTFFFNVFSEQDDKNQTLQQDLSNEEKYFLSQIGNDIDKAVVPRIDSVGYNENEVLYRKTDSLVYDSIYHEVYIHSNDPELAVYRLRFSFVGEGNGDYLLENSVANGRVFRWYAPENDIRQGSYAPVVLLVTPKKKQVISVGGSQALGSMTRTNFEFVLSNNDLNTFSSLDKEENLGYAVNFELYQEMLKRDTSRIQLRGQAAYRHFSKYFSSVERFRSVEFERDWNLEDSPTREQEHLATVGLQFYEAKAGRIRYNAEFMQRGSDFEGIRNTLLGNLKYSGFEFDVNASLLNSSEHLNDTKFLRHRTMIAKHFRYAILGIKEEGEQNRWTTRRNDSLSPNSFAFQEFEVFLTQPDTIQNRGYLSYRNRRDYYPGDNQLVYATLGQDLNLGANLLKNPASQLRVMLTYRELSIKDSTLSENKPENSLLGRIEYGLQLAKGAITASTFWEVGSGLESEREFSYLEVAPGQGVYQWIDYNQNGLKELDEFEVAQFQDEARYIRIFFPSSNFMTVYSNQFNQTINLNPARIWKTRDGFHKGISLFSNQFAYRINRKNTNTDILKNLNPFFSDLNDPDLLTISTSVRNNLSFNKTGRVFGVDYLFLQNLNRTFLANGFDTRTIQSHGLRARVTINDQTSVINQFDNGEKSFASEFLSSRDYEIDFISNKLSTQFQFSRAFRLVADYGYKNQVNRLDVQQSEEHNLGTELRYSKLNKGILTCRVNYVHLSYNDDPASPVGYEMLQGLLPGHNGTWNLLFQRTITGGIEVNLEYAGRVSENQSVIHTGGLSVRANF